MVGIRLHNERTSDQPTTLHSRPQIPSLFLKGLELWSLETQTLGNNSIQLKTMKFPNGERFKVWTTFTKSRTFGVRVSRAPKRIGKITGSGEEQDHTQMSATLLRFACISTSSKKEGRVAPDYLLAAADQPWVVCGNLSTNMSV